MQKHKSATKIKKNWNTHKWLLFQRTIWWNTRDTAEKEYNQSSPIQSLVIVWKWSLTRSNILPFSNLQSVKRRTERRKTQLNLGLSFFLTHRAKRFSNLQAKARQNFAMFNKPTTIPTLNKGDNVFINYNRSCHYAPTWPHKTEKLTTKNSLNQTKI